MEIGQQTLIIIPRVVDRTKYKQTTKIYKISISKKRSENCQKYIQYEFNKEFKHILLHFFSTNYRNVKQNFIEKIVLSQRRSTRGLYLQKKQPYTIHLNI